jgi:hypothetical protein
MALRKNMIVMSYPASVIFRIEPGCDRPSQIRTGGRPALCGISEVSMPNKNAKRALLAFGTLALGLLILALADRN